MRLEPGAPNRIPSNALPHFFRRIRFMMLLELEDMPAKIEQFTERGV